MERISLPGLIDAHVHLRDMGQNHKEDFYSGTCVALAGGFTTVLDMPNNKLPITSLLRLEKKISEARKKAVCDIGFYFCSVGDNFEEFSKVGKIVFGLKLYLSPTTGNYLLEKSKLESVYKHWENETPILIHSEESGERTIEDVIRIVKKYNRRTHICHVASRFEMEKIILAKNLGLPITCGVTPHHLFLSKADEKILGPFALMKPPLLEKNEKEFLWKNLRYVDIFESDHAPHTIDEKKLKTPPYGVPGLETTLPLFLTEVSNGRLTLKDIVDRVYYNPAKIFGVKTDKSSRIEVGLSDNYVIKNENLKTKCGWSPFNGWKVKGRVKRVFIRGKEVFRDGEILVNPGEGQVVVPRQGEVVK